MHVFFASSELDDFLTQEHSDDGASGYDERRELLMDEDYIVLVEGEEESDWDDFDENRIYRDAELP